MDKQLVGGLLGLLIVSCLQGLTAPKGPPRDWPTCFRARAICQGNPAIYTDLAKCHQGNAPSYSAVTPGNPTLFRQFEPLGGQIQGNTCISLLKKFGNPRDASEVSATITAALLRGWPEIFKDPCQTLVVSSLILPGSAPGVLYLTR